MVMTYGAKATAVILKPGAYDAVLKSHVVTRTLDLKTLRAKPTLRIGETDVDFKPVFDNPRSLPNISQKLRAMPALVTVREDVLEASELRDLGLAMRSSLTYQLKPGACNILANRRKLSDAGISCFERKTDAQRASAFGAQFDPHYIADPAKRATTIKQNEQMVAEMDAKAKQRIAEFRGQLAQPNRRAQLAAAVSESELQRLGGLPDDALIGELINMSQVRLEQTAFVPRLDDAQKPKTITLSKLVEEKSPTSGKATGAPPEPDGDVSTSLALPPLNYLTGFTLGREYEWRKRIETSIDWCIIGCTETYYAEAYAGFGYGFGLRMPIRMEGNYAFTRKDGVETASFTPKITPFDGSLADYQGLLGPESKQLFNGQELVAEFGARAGGGIKIPFYPELRIDLDEDDGLGLNFTKGLQKPFENGNFTPPLPNQPGPTLVKVFDDFDLLGGRLNFGVAGAKIFPAIKAELVSEKLQFLLKDQITGQETLIQKSGDAINLAINSADKSSVFTLEKPLYNLGFELTPGMNARFFIDIVVWGANWDLPVWFPQLGIKLPKDGVDFGCHINTVCKREVRVTPTGINPVKETKTTISTDLINWGNNFLSKWSGGCLPPDGVQKTCKTSIFLWRVQATTAAKKKADEKPGTTMIDLQPLLASYDDKARAEVLLTYTLRTATNIKYKKQECLDDQCRVAIDALIATLSKPNLDYSIKYAGVDFGLAAKWIEDDSVLFANQMIAASKKKAGK